jgi:hypothetical protein
MPNIHCFGFSAEEYPQFKSIFNPLLKSIDLHLESITTWHPDVKPESCDGTKTRRPYLAFTATSEKQANEIIAVMVKAELYYDVEPGGEKFISREAMIKMGKGNT